MLTLKHYYYNNIQRNQPHTLTSTIIVSIPAGVSNEKKTKINKQKQQQICLPNKTYKNNDEVAKTSSIESTDHGHHSISINGLLPYIPLIFKPGPHQQHCRSNVVEATGTSVASCFDIVAVLDNNVDCRSNHRLCRSNIRLRSIRQCCSDLLGQTMC